MYTRTHICSDCPWRIEKRADIWEYIHTYIHTRIHAHIIYTRHISAAFVYCVLWSNPMCCSVLQCVAVCCSMLQCNLIFENTHLEHGHCNDDGTQKRHQRACVRVCMCAGVLSCCQWKPHERTLHAHTSCIMCHLLCIASVVILIQYYCQDTPSIIYC